MDLIVQYVISEISKLGLASPRTLLLSPPNPWLPRMPVRQWRVDSPLGVNNTPATAAL